MDPRLTDDPYRDPDLYDLEYADMNEDVAFYVAQAWQSDGPILELGCGTGRLTLPIARTGAEIVGVDLSEAMLAGLRRKLEREPSHVAGRVGCVQGDFRTTRLGRAFDRVLWPFNALHHNRSDAELDASLATLVAHLAPHGLVVLDAYLPDLELYDRDPSERFESRTFIDPRTGTLLESWEQGWWDATARVHHVVYHYQHPNGRIERAHLPFRMWELHELHDAFHRAGLVVEHEAEDFQGAPITEASLKLVATLRRAP